MDVLAAVGKWYLQRCVMSGIGYGLMGVSWALTFSAQVAVYAVCWLFLSERQLILMLGYIFRYLSSFVIRWTPWWSLHVLGDRPLEPRRTIVVCNHLSNGDAFFLSSALLPFETKWIAKASLFKVPLGGWSMSLAGDLPVHFTHEKNGWGLRKGSVAELMRKARWYLERDIPLTVFPEGGRSLDGIPRPFKDGFFKLAIDTQADIQPCAMTGTEQAWPIHNRLLAPAKVFVRFGKPISSKGHTVDTLRDETYTAITNLLKMLPPPDMPQ